jgi:hypothetical protein
VLKEPRPQRYSPFWLYFLAYPVVLAGLVIYFWHATRNASLASFAPVMLNGVCGFISRRTGHSRSQGSGIHEATKGGKRWRRRCGGGLSVLEVSGHAAVESFLRSSGQGLFEGHLVYISCKFRLKEVASHILRQSEGCFGTRASVGAHFARYFARAFQVRQDPDDVQRRCQCSERRRKIVISCCQP